MTYGAYLSRLSRINPSDYQDDGTQEHLRALGAPLDDAATRARAAMLARLVATAPEDALAMLGEERGLVRYPGEYLAAYRNRVLNAWAFWQQAGTLPGMTLALEHLGYGVRIGTISDLGDRVVFDDGLLQSQYSVRVPVNPGDTQDGTYTLTVGGETFELPTVIIPADLTYPTANPTRIIEHWRHDCDIWAEFSLYLTPTRAEFTTDAWDDPDVWDDESLWDITLRAGEVDRIRSVIEEIKPAHARLRGIYLIQARVLDLWDDPDVWDDATVWEASTPITLYERTP